jgi:malate/lactate dehydrogenase
MKVLIIGTGKIGGYAAFSLLKSKRVQKLVIVGSSLLKTSGICQDLKDAYPHKSIETIQLNQIDDETFDLTILAFSTLKWNPGIDVNDRLIEAKANIGVLDEINKDIGFERLGTIVVVSNPVDILTTYIASKSEQANVIGFGLSIDEKRITRVVNGLFKKEYAKVPCIGEHGVSIVPLLSQLLPESDCEEALYDKIKKLSFEATSTIIRNVSIPVYGPLSEIEVLLETIINKESKVISASYFLNDPLFGESRVAVGLPVEFDKGKIAGYQLPEISETEAQMFKKSVSLIKQNYSSIIG